MIYKILMVCCRVAMKIFPFISLPVVNCSFVSTLVGAVMKPRVETKSNCKVVIVSLATACCRGRLNLRSCGRALAFVIRAHCLV